MNSESKVNATISDPKKDEKEEILKEAIKKTIIADSTKNVNVIVMRLNIREHANQNAKIVKTVPSGTTLKVNTTPAGEYYKVVEPVKGYVLTKYVG